MKKITTLLFLALAAGNLQAQLKQTWPEDLIITPERSNFDKTSTYADVLKLINTRKGRSRYIQVGGMGKGKMVKEIQFVIMTKRDGGTHEKEEAAGKAGIEDRGKNM